MSELTLEALEQRIAQLEASLITANETIINLQGTMVEITADHINRLFNDPVMLDSIAQRVLVAGANAIAYKAKMSRQKAPELIVLEGYLPGAIRATLQEDGAFIEMEEKDQPGVWVNGTQLPEQFQSQELRQAFGELLISYGAELGKTYFIMESRDVEEARQKAQSLAMSLTDPVAPVATGDYSMITRGRGLDGSVAGEDNPVMGVAADQQFEVKCIDDDGYVTVNAANLSAGDVIKVARDGCTMLEEVVSIKPLNPTIQ